METRKQVLKMALVVSILSSGVALLLLSSTSHDALAQTKSQQKMMNGTQQPGMHTGSMGTNMTMDQMLDRMDMMHDMMHDMMRMMMSQNAGMMNSSNNMMNPMNMNTGMQ